jgi:hypothetical protein
LGISSIKASSWFYADDAQLSFMTQQMGTFMKSRDLFYISFATVLFSLAISAVVFTAFLLDFLPKITSMYFDTQVIRIKLKETQMIEGKCNYGGEIKGMQILCTPTPKKTDSMFENLPLGGSI